MNPLLSLSLGSWHLDLFLSLLLRAQHLGRGCIVHVLKAVAAGGVPTFAKH